MTDTFTDRFGQQVGAGDFVVYGTRVGNVAETRFAMVTSVDTYSNHTTVSVKPLQRDGTGWKFGRTSKPTTSNIVCVDLPKSSPTLSEGS